MQAVLIRMDVIWIIELASGTATDRFTKKERIMMKLVLTVALLATSTASFAQNYVNPYMKNDGTYVQGHYKSAPDHNAYNNYSSQGNSNPYTGQQGTRDPVQVQQQYQPSQPSYGGSNNHYGQPSRQRNGY